MDNSKSAHHKMALSWVKVPFTCTFYILSSSALGVHLQILQYLTPPWSGLGQDLDLDYGLPEGAKVHLRSAMFVTDTDNAIATESQKITGYCSRLKIHTNYTWNSVCEVFYRL